MRGYILDCFLNEFLDSYSLVFIKCYIINYLRNISLLFNLLDKAQKTIIKQ